MDELGKLDAVVLNAGVLRLNTVDVVTLEELDLMIDVNIRGVFLAIQAAVAQMKDGGRVITIGSNTAERTGFRGSSVYQFTKAAVAAMVKGLALDLAPRRITVNNVQPGPTNTDMNAGSIEFLADRSPLKRVADPAEIAELVSYLAGPGSAYMTGASLLQLMEDGSFEGACGDGTPRGIDLNHSRSGGYGSGTMDRSLSASGTFIILEIVVGTLRLFALPERRRQQFKEIRSRNAVSSGLTAARRW
ncbi:hypothetical protein ABIE40_005945 [Rhizobium sp. OAE497]